MLLQCFGKAIHGVHHGVLDGWPIFCVLDASLFYKVADAADPSVIRALPKEWLAEGLLHFALLRVKVLEDPPVLCVVAGVDGEFHGGLSFKPHDVVEGKAAFSGASSKPVILPRRR